MFFKRLIIYINSTVSIYPDFLARQPYFPLYKIRVLLILKRKYNVKGYVEDPAKALETYGYRVIKKVWQDRLVEEVKPYLDAIKDDKLKSGVKSYLRQVLGYPTPEEEVLAHTLNSVINSRIGRILTQMLFRKPGASITPVDVRKGMGFANVWLNHVGMMGLMISRL